MSMSLVSLYQDINIHLVLNFLISTGLGLCGFFVAWMLKRSQINGKWFTSLRYILTGLSISALSNSYSLVLLGYKTVQPSELLLNFSIFVLMIWATLYYIYNVIGEGTSLTEDKVLNFIKNEHTKLDK